MDAMCRCVLNLWRQELHAIQKVFLIHEQEWGRGLSVDD
jgi:hypothetical protein